MGALTAAPPVDNLATSGGRPLYTVGHSNRTLADFVAILQEAGIDLLVDVRRFPGSRRHPQFGRDALAEGLAAAGIGYRHDERLGGRRSPRESSPNGAWHNDQFRGYADHMASAEFRAAVEQLVREVGEHTVTVMCAEAVPWSCHRQLLADAVAVAGTPVVHLLARGDRRPHRMHERLRVVAAGELTYPPAETLPLFADSPVDAVKPRRRRQPATGKKRSGVGDET